MASLKRGDNPVWLALKSGISMMPPTRVPAVITNHEVPGDEAFVLLRYDEEICAALREFYGFEWKDTEDGGESWMLNDAVDPRWDAQFEMIPGDGRRIHTMLFADYPMEILDRSESPHDDFSIKWGPFKIEPRPIPPLKGHFEWIRIETTPFTGLSRMIGHCVMHADTKIANSLPNVLVTNQIDQMNLDERWFTTISGSKYTFDRILD